MNECSRAMEYLILHCFDPSFAFQLTHAKKRMMIGRRLNVANQKFMGPIKRKSKRRPRIIM